MVRNNWSNIADISDFANMIYLTLLILLLNIIGDADTGTNYDILNLDLNFPA